MTPEQIRDRLDRGMQSLLAYSDAPWNMSSLQKRELVLRLKSVTGVRREIEGLIDQRRPHDAAHERLSRLLEDFDHQLEALRKFGAPFLPACKEPREFVSAAARKVQQMMEIAHETLQVRSSSKAKEMALKALDLMLEQGAAIESAMDADLVTDALKFEATRNLDSMDRLMCAAERLKKKSSARARPSDAAHSPVRRPDPTAGASSDRPSPRPPRPDVPPPRRGAPPRPDVPPPRRGVPPRPDAPPPRRAVSPSSPEVPPALPPRGGASGRGASRH